MNNRLKERIEQMVANGETVKELYDLSNPIDLFVFERVCHHRYLVPLIIQYGTENLPEDLINNCKIELYKELKTAGKILESPANEAPLLS